MKRRLDQVLRIRELMENLARAALETKTHAVRQLENAAKRENSSALESRREAFTSASDSGPIDQGAWRLGLADAEIFARRGERFRIAAEAQKPAVSEAREAMLERRRERKQVETLIAEARRIADEERERRQQQQTDDWFQSRRNPRR